MKTKLLWFVGITVLGLLVAYGQRTVSSGSLTGAQVGRYQLFQGQFTIAGAESTQRGTDVFRIDTVTGETAVYINGMGNNGAPVQYWSPIIKNWSPPKP